MHFMFGRVLVLLGLLMPLVVSAQSLGTAPPNNGEGGIFFDLQPTSGALTMFGFDTAVAGAAGSNATVEVWTRSGSYVGATGSSNGWTLREVMTVVTRGTSVSTPFMLATPITLPAGQVTGFYLHPVGSPGLRYTGNNSVPPQENFSNGDLTLSSRVAKIGATTAFGGTDFAPRTFSGAIRYTHALPTAAPNNGSGGSFLNLQAVDRALTVTGFDVFLESAAGAATSVEVWTRPGTYEGFTATSYGWTLSQTVAAQSQGVNAATTFLLDQPIEVSASAITAVYLHSVTEGGGIRYTGTAGVPPQTLWSNADLVLFADRSVAGSTPFAASQFTPRAFAGRVLYTKAFTTAVANSGDGGVFMDLRSLDGGLALTGFDLPLAGNAGVTASVEVWTRTGSYIDHTDSNVGWTRHQVVTSRTQPPGRRTPFLMNPLPISSSTITAVYLHGLTPGAGIQYTASTGAPLQTTWANSDLSLYSDLARTGSAPFAGDSVPERTFSGLLRYTAERNLFRDGFED